MITDVDFLTEGMSAPFNAGRRALKDFYRPDLASNARDAWTAAFNEILPPARLITERSNPAHFRESYALLNDPDALIASYLAGLTGAWSGQLDPALGRLWLDEAGTTPATAPGDVIRRLDHLAGTVSHVTFADLQAPVLGRHPTSGIRNRANGVAAVDDAALWPASVSNNGITATKLSTGTDPDGPWVIYEVAGTASANSFCIVYAMPVPLAAAAVGQTWTASAIAERVSGSDPGSGGGSGSGLRFDLVERDAADGVLFNSTSATFAPATETSVTHSRTFATAGAVKASLGVTLRTADGTTVNYQIKIKAVQFEQASARTAYQTNLSQFDITEAPFADCWYLAPDGMNDFGTFSTAFAPAGAYTLAAAMNAPGGVRVPIIGRSAASTAIEITSGNNPVILSNGSSNQRLWTGGAAGRQTLIGRVRGTADYDMRRSGVDLAENTGAAAGNIFPIANPFDTLFRTNVAYAPAGTRLYSYLLADANLSDPRRNALERVLARHSGVTLP